jgi:hypothetical protein
MRAFSRAPKQRSAAAQPPDPMGSGGFVNSIRHQRLSRLDDNSAQLLLCMPTRSHVSSFFSFRKKLEDKEGAKKNLFP